MKTPAISTSLMGFAASPSFAGEHAAIDGYAFAGDGERAGSARRFASLAYAAGDSFQYALDAETDALVSLANNAGTLETIAKITVDGASVDLAPMGGFDIVSAKEGEDSAGLCGVELETGAALRIADLGMSGITGFAASLGM